MLPLAPTAISQMVTPPTVYTNCHFYAEFWTNTKIELSQPRRIVGRKRRGKKDCKGGVFALLKYTSDMMNQGYQPTYAATATTSTNPFVATEEGNPFDAIPDVAGACIYAL